MIAYFQRVDLRKRKGPGKVIGQDGQQVLIKHGGMYVRVHPCGVLLGKASVEEKDCDEDEVNDVTRDSRTAEELRLAITLCIYDNKLMIIYRPNTSDLPNQCGRPPWC